jgi:hypothetical protein
MVISVQFRSLYFSHSFNWLALGQLGCIVNLAGNLGLEHGADVPQSERQALIDLYYSTKGDIDRWYNTVAVLRSTDSYALKGPRWNIRTNWMSTEPVYKWYKVTDYKETAHDRSYKLRLSICCVLRLACCRHMCIVSSWAQIWWMVHSRIPLEH